jgi:hypothetical protein
MPAGAHQAQVFVSPFSIVHVDCRNRHFKIEIVSRPFGVIIENE